MTDVLNVQENARFLLTRNGAKLYEQVFSPTAETYTRHASDRVVLAANMANYQAASLGDIDGSNPGAHLLVVADRSIYIAVNTTSQYIYADSLMMVGTSVTALYFKNTDADNTATVEFVVTD